MKLSKKLQIEDTLQRALTAVLEEGQSLEEALSAYPDLQDELRPRLETALWLISRKEALEMRPGFLPVSKGRLLDSIQQVASSLPGRLLRFFSQLQRQSLRFRWVYRVAVMGLFLGMLVMVLFQTADLSLAAIPGDSLYPVKRFVEKVQLVLSLDPLQNARLQVDFSRRRSDEIAAVIFEGRLELLRPAVDAFQLQVSQARLALQRIQPAHRIQAAVLEKSLSEMVETQNIILRLLVQAVPEQARVEVQHAMEVSLR